MALDARVMLRRWRLKLLVKVFVEVNLFDEFESVLFGSLDECVKRNQEFVDIQDLTRHEALAYSIG